MDRAQKAAAVESFRDSLSQAESVVLTEFHGLTVEEANHLRRTLAEGGVQFKVFKNTLARRAIEGTRLEVLSGELTGPTAWAYSVDDPVAPAKALISVLKAELANHVKIKRGYLDGRALDVDEVDALAKLPGRDELRSKLLSVLLASATQLVRVLSARPVEFLQVLKARAADLGEES